MYTNSDKIICKPENCTGCYACANICPKSCIEMRADNDLALRPFIDTNICINCGLCEKVCPENNISALSTPIDVFAAYSKDEEIHISSTSGGIAAELAGYFVSTGGIVYASSESNLSISFIRCESKNDIKKIQGSKYFQSFVGTTYQDVKKDLDKNINVLFIGTPCQIAALKCFLGSKEYDGLLTVDIICHGIVPSEVFRQYSKHILGNNFDNASSCTFRKQNDYVLTYYDKHGSILNEEGMRSDYYLSAFLDGYSFRENCYNCKYACEKRISDITLGDFLGLKNPNCLGENAKNGINAVLVNSQKGKAYFEAISHRLVSDKRTLEEAVSGNSQLRQPENDSEISVKFRKLCKNRGAVYALKNYSLKKCTFIKIRKIVYHNKVLFKLFSKIPILKNKI
ncbi:MAG: Coenzyme F420 hydrogenase/dehydrogenase, beta subunit C-terminal domain [Eubacterium sp.]